jgi:hypothetical protein
MHVPAVRHIPPRLAPQDRAANPNDGPATGRSLVCVIPAQGVTNRHDYTRPSAAFLAQLIAAHTGAPQSRSRRRASAADASALYAAAAAHPLPAGRIIRQSR